MARKTIAVRKSSASWSNAIRIGAPHTDRAQNTTARRRAQGPNVSTKRRSPGTSGASLPSGSVALRLLLLAGVLFAAGRRADRALLRAAVDELHGAILGVLLHDARRA